jgi:hypothetical protein
LAEPLAGTAAVASAWLCVEQTGPYGYDGLRDSHFDRAVGEELARRASAAAVRIQLIRRPGRHADQHRAPTRRHVYVAHTRPGTTWLEHAVIDDPAELLDLDLAAVAAGIRPGLGERDDRPRLLVCTNGRRDLCCAVVGRALAADLVERHGDQVWETTHTGGHRFAPTAVLLPTGYLYGRLDGAFVDELLAVAASGRVVTERCRGRSSWGPAGQVAELAVREQSGLTGVDTLTVAAEEHAGDDWEVRVTSRTGRVWSVTGRTETLSPARRTSCAKEPVTPTGHVVTGVAEIVSATVGH